MRQVIADETLSKDAEKKQPTEGSKNLGKEYARYFISDLPQAEAVLETITTMRQVKR
jgi:hypothetical protein